MAWTTARESTSAAALPITYSANAGSPSVAMLIRPVPTAKTGSPSYGVWVGLMARASPASAIGAIFGAWGFVDSTCVATTAIVVCRRRPPGTAAGLAVRGRGPPSIRTGVANSHALTLQTLHDPARRRQTVGAAAAQRDGVDDLDQVLRPQQVGFSRPGRASALTHATRHALAALLGDHDSRARQRIAREVADPDAGHVGDGVVRARHLGPAG